MLIITLNAHRSIVKQFLRPAIELQEMGQPPFVPARISSIQVKKSLPGNLPELVEMK
jgi:hypothetical protein